MGWTIAAATHLSVPVAFVLAGEAAETRGEAGKPTHCLIRHSSPLGTCLTEITGINLVMLFSIRFLQEIYGWCFIILLRKIKPKIENEKRKLMS